MQCTPNGSLFDFYLIFPFGIQGVVLNRADYLNLKVEHSGLS